MDRTLDKGGLWDLFKRRALVATNLPPGSTRDIAYQVNEAEGRGDATLRTKAEYSALFDALLRTESPTAGGVLTLRDNGRLTTVGQAIEDYLKVAVDTDEFFDQPMYAVHVTGWPANAMQPEKPVNAPAGARLEVWRIDPSDGQPTPAPGAEGVLFSSPRFSLVNSGNRTLRVPKRSWKVNLEAHGADGRLVGMSRLNLKAMFNDPAQMRETLSWTLFDASGVPACRHSYARLAFDWRYLGLFFLIQQVDKAFLSDHFGGNDKGNLYKAACADIGCATLEHRVGDGGDDSGRQYHRDGPADNRTYLLKTNEEDSSANTYDDLAAFIRTINGVGLPGGDGAFDTDAFRESVEGIMNARAFLRWASVNVLVGSWDNYFATPSNYYLYNSGRKDAAADFVSKPYFTFVPWDYDNSFGIDYFGTQWQHADLLDWPASTKAYLRKNGSKAARSRIPLVTNLLANHDFRQYYLDHVEHLLDTHFNRKAITDQIGTDPGAGVWERVRHAAYLEAESPTGPPFTGRQFTNDEVYRAGYQQNELWHGEAHVEGIVNFVRMRHDRAREQLAKLRAEYPRGASGASFTGVMEALPGHR